MRGKLFVLAFLTLIFTLAAASAEPLLNPIGSKSVNEGSALTFDITTRNLNSNTTAFSFVSSPAMGGASLNKVDNSKATFTWTPGFSSSGNYLVNFTVYDNINNATNTTASENVTITVNNVNRAPTLSTIGSRQVNEGQLLQFTITASDPDGDALSYAASGIPSGAIFNATTRVFSWMPDSTQSGTHAVNFSVSDNSSLSAYEMVSITVNDVPTNLTLTSLTLGDKDSKRSNPQAKKSENRILYKTGTVTLTNTGLDTITGLSFAAVPTGKFTASALNMTAAISSTSISSGETAIMSVTANIPSDLDGVDSSLNPSAFSVATFIVRGTTPNGASVIASAPISMQAKNSLKIREVAVSVNNGEKTDTVSDGGRVTNVKPGSKISLEVKIENKFSKDDDVSLQSINVNSKIDALDVSDSETISSITASNSKKAIIKFEIPSDADKSDYTVEIEADADDENGAKHGDKIDFTIEVDRQDHELSISPISLNPDTIDCQASTELRFSVKNTGNNDEDNAFIRIAAPDIQFGNIIGPFNLDQSSSKSSTIQIPIKQNLTAGVKRITVESYYEGDQLSDSKTALLNNNKCQETGTPPPQNNPTTPPENKKIEVIEQPKQPVFASPPPATGKEEAGFKFSDSPLYIPALVIANLMVLILAIFLIGKLFSRG